MSSSLHLLKSIDQFYVTAFQSSISLSSLLGLLFTRILLWPVGSVKTLFLPGSALIKMCPGISSGIEFCYSYLQYLKTTWQALLSRFSLPVHCSPFLYFLPVDAYASEDRWSMLQSLLLLCHRTDISCTTVTAL